MNIIFKEEALSELYTTGKTKDKKYSKICKDKRLVQGYQRAVSIMYSVRCVNDLKAFSFLHYERLRHYQTLMSSVRIVNGMIERLIFSESEDGIEIELIEIDNTHYGNKK